MINKKRKGFTIVELVIVIAVIAILAAVLIPTFSGIIDRANESAALQEVQNAYIKALADALGSDLKDTTVEADGFKFTFSDATGQNATIKGPDDFNYSAKVENGVVVLGPASGGNGESDGAGGGSGGVTTAEDLINALADGGEVTLGDDIVLDTALEIAEGEATINLAGHTLTLVDPSNESVVANVLTVSGTLTIKDSSNGDERGTIDIKTTNNEDAWNLYCGICVEEGGTLKLDNVNLIGRRLYNIGNFGTLQLTNSTYYVKDGFGLAHSGDADDAVSEVKNCTMIAAGTGTQLYSCAGIMNVTGTTFSEDDNNFVSYHYSADAPIQCHNSTKLTMENVTVNVKPGQGNYSVLASNEGTLVIKSGEFNEIIGCNYTATIYLYGGTFYDGEKSVSYNEITADSTIFEGNNCKLTPGENCWIIGAAS